MQHEYLSLKGKYIPGVTSGGPGGGEKNISLILVFYHVPVLAGFETKTSSKEK